MGSFSSDEYTEFPFISLSCKEIVLVEVLPLMKELRKFLPTNRDSRYWCWLRLKSMRNQWEINEKSMRNRLEIEAYQLKRRMRVRARNRSIFAPLSIEILSYRQEICNYLLYYSNYIHRCIHACMRPLRRSPVVEKFWCLLQWRYSLYSFRLTVYTMWINVYDVGKRQ